MLEQHKGNFLVFTSAAYLETAFDISVFIFKYFLTNLNLIGLSPIKSSKTKI